VRAFRGSGLRTEEGGTWTGVVVAKGRTGRCCVHAHPTGTHPAFTALREETSFSSVHSFGGFPVAFPVDPPLAGVSTAGRPSFVGTGAYGASPAGGPAPLRAGGGVGGSVKVYAGAAAMGLPGAGGGRIVRSEGHSPHALPPREVRIQV